MQMYEWIKPFIRRVKIVYQMDLVKIVKSFTW